MTVTMEYADLNQLDQEWYNGKSSTESRIQSFLHAFP